MHNQFKTQKFKYPMLPMGPRDLNSAPYSPVHCSSHSMTSFQSSELTELPVVENSQLFAQRAHSARYAPSVVHFGSSLRMCCILTGAGAQSEYSPVDCAAQLARTTGCTPVGCMSYKLSQSCHWSVPEKCGTCFLCSIVCLMSFLPTPSILKAEMEDCGYNVVAFRVGVRSDWGAKGCTYGKPGHDVCIRGKK